MQLINLTHSPNLTSELSGCVLQLSYTLKLKSQMSPANYGACTHCWKNLK